MRKSTWKPLALLVLSLAAACGGSGSSGSAERPVILPLRVVVTGVLGTGLVLHSSLGDDLPVLSDGTHPFPTGGVAGTAYTVTITAQPANPWQTCTLGAGASGVLAGSDAPIAVTCTTNRYAVSAHVAGLAGTGLSLRLDGGEVVDPAADGTVAFVTSIASGELATVAVAAQPTAPWQTCAGGSATVADRAVTVDVTCTTNRYHVGGAATGILGGGLSLRCGGDTLTLDADGAFTFATAIASGEPWSVTTVAVPATETCAIAGGAGIMAGADAGAVAVTCGCLAGRGNCDGVAANGCEADTTSELANCGGCGLACSYPNASATCAGGACQLASCSAGWEDCNAVAADGCETHVASDPSHCGGCNTACSIPHAVAGCASGSCTLASCSPGWVDCNADPSDGCETPTTTGACPTCTDLARNQDETDVDCGGSTCPRCAVGKACAVDADCASGVCSPGTLTCAAPQVVVVVRVGDGSAGLSQAAAPVFLEARSALDGALDWTVALPTVAAGANQMLTLGGADEMEGALSRSADGRYLTLAGYAAPPGVGNVASTSAATTNRVVARVDASRSVDTSTHANLFDGTYVTGATSADGTGFWVSGGPGYSLTYLGFGGASGPTRILWSPVSTRACGISAAQLYCDSGNTSWNAPFRVGTGLPTTTVSATLDPAGVMTAGASPYAFLLLDRDPNVAGLDTLYLADDRGVASGGGLQKWTSDGVTWTLARTFTGGISTGLRGLAAFVQGGSVVLVATTTEGSANRLVKLVDDGTASPAFTTLATAPATTVYRGVALAPTP